MNPSEDSVRLDRWLHAIRVYKTRSRSAEAISGGKVKVNGHAVKPHKLIKPGDLILLKKDGRSFQYEVVQPIQRRVGAKLAVECYRVEEDPGMDLESKRMLKLMRDLARQQPRTRGRPTKRDRRQIEKLKQQPGDE